MKPNRILAWTLLLLMGCTVVKAQTLPYQDESVSFHNRAVDLVNRLTLAEKAQQMGNNVAEAVSRDDVSGTGTVSIPAYQYWNEALHGVARSGAATSFPESKGMSATWDRQLIFDCASAISDEARVYRNLYGKGLNYWCPTINMSRDPRWGRDEENYGEDPFLAGQLAVQFIKGMQGNDPKYLKTVACAKHFAANNYEQGRQGSTSFMTKHNLFEYYLPAFEASVKEGGVKSIMSSYNALSTDLNEKNAAGIGWSDKKAWGGKPNAMNDWLLTGILRNQWGFDGYVTSDCAGVSCIYRKVKHFYYGDIYGTYDESNTEILADYQAHATADAIKAGNDMNCEFKNTAAVFQTAIEAAITKGYMTEDDLDRALIRVLETRFALGEFDSTNPWSSLGSETLESDANQALALKAAQESIVLLKNDIPEGGESPLLPISADKTVAIIGPYANQIMLGDYSGTPTYTTTPFQAFATKMDFTTRQETYNFVDYTTLGQANQGAAKFNKDGIVQNTKNGDWIVFDEIDFGEGCTDFTINCATKSGNGEGTVNFYLDLDDSDIASATADNAALSVSNSSIAAGGWTTYADVTGTVDANIFKGKHKVTIKFISSQSYVGNWKTFRFYNPDENPLESNGPLYMVQTSDEVNVDATEDLIARAVAVAQKADVVVFCGGTDYSKPDNHATGTESHDRWLITMPGNQTALLQAVYAVNKNVVLVLETNSSMDITWEKANLPAILEAWYGGQAQGQAICDVIYGDVNPSGKLTSTWYNALNELPAAADSQFGANGMLEYNIDDWGYTYMYYGKGTGANVSRQAAAPMYPFGYGLSYTTFAYSNPSFSSDQVSCTITNTGDRKGAEVVQVYVSFPNSSVSHIQKLNRRLVGFERVELEAGQSTQVTFPISKKQLAYFKDDSDEWWIEGGTVNVYISASSADDRLTGSFNTTAEMLEDCTINLDNEEPVVTGTSIPTAADTYISWDNTQNEYVTVSNASIENSGASIGSTGASTVATFTIGNSTKQDYVLTFKTAAQNLTAEIDVTLTNSKNKAVLEKVAEVKNTGSWYFNGSETIHTYLISNLPVGTYTLKLATKSTTGTYAGNWGYLAFRAASDYDAIPGTLTLSKGTYSGNGMKTENSDTNVGFIKNGSCGTHVFINETAGVHQMAMDIKRMNAGTMNIKIVDGNSGETEVDYDYTIPEAADYTTQNILLPGELSTGIKTMTLTFSSESSGYICNYKAPTFTKLYDHIAKVSSATIAEQTVTTGDNTDWYCALPVVYDETTTITVNAAYGTVNVTAKDESDNDVAVTNNGDGTYTLVTPALNKATTVTIALTAGDGAYATQTSYTLKLFRIGELSLTSVTVDGVALSDELLSDINNSETTYTATYDGCYTTAPTVAAVQIDGANATVGEPVIEGSTYTYTIHGAIEKTDLNRDYTLVLNNVHVYATTGNESTVDIKANGGTISNNTWSNGTYSLATNSLDSYNQYFKMNGNSYTLSVPADVVVKQLIMKDCSNNYSGNDARLTAVTSTGATTYVPVDNKYYHESEGEKHDIIVNIDGHVAGTDIVLTQQKKGQPMAWIQLTTVKQNPGTAPTKTAETVKVVRNHAVVSMTFDREIPNDVTATINGGTVTAEGGSAVLTFPVWNLDYSTNYTLSIVAGAVKDAYNNTNAAAIEVPVNTSAKPVVAQAEYDYVVSTADELKDAIAEIDATNTSAAAARKTIFLKNGIYNLGGDGSTNTVQWVNAHNISFIGESKEGVIICGNSADISNPVLNIRYGSGQYMQDLTVRNLRDFDSANRKGVSVAVYGGNKAIFKNVALQAQQDTQVTGESGYYLNCDFYGAVDFLCGGGDHFYDQCRFIMTNSGYITAPSTSAANKWGYVMQHCTIDKYVGSYTYEADGNFTLGRPWQGEPRNYWLNTTMKVQPSEGGWSGMGTLVTHFYEYNSMDANGNAIDLTGRVNPSSSANSYTPVLTDEEAAKFTVENVLGGTDSWLPTEECVTLAAPTVTREGTTLSWTAVDDARCYVVFKDGQYLTNQTATTLTGIEKGRYVVRAANEMGGLGDASTALVYADVTLDENIDYTPEAQADVDVVLIRTINANKWSTIVLPCDVDDVTTVFGDDAEVAQLTGFENGKLQFSAVTSMTAHEPYIIKVSKVLTGATISNTSITVGTSEKSVSGVDFVGSYDALTNIPASSDDYGYYFLAGNKLYKTKSSGTANTMKGFRAYFKVAGAMAANELSFEVSGETTSLRDEVTVHSSKFKVQSIYDLQGRRVAHPTKGLYIVNGKKVVIK